MTSDNGGDHADAGDAVSRETLVASQVFPHAMAGLQAFHDRLATAGVERGLIGPREVPRLWDRHLLNCAAVAELIPADQRIADVGSGAGLPGIVIALVRPDLHVTLIEPLARRSSFLEESVTQLNLAERVTVTRGRAEDRHHTQGATFDSVTARAVAPLDRLLTWCLPLVAPHGRLLAIKGSRAEEEVAQARASVPAGAEITIERCGTEYLESPTTVVVVHRDQAAGVKERER